jgi:outer membrane protein
MNKAILALVPATVLGAALALSVSPLGAEAAGADNSEVRVVDLEAVIEKSSKAKSITNAFKQFQEKKRTELKKKEQEVAALQNTLTRESPPEKLNEYARKVQEIQGMLQQAEVDSQKEFMKTREQLLTALRPTFEAYAREKGVGILLDKTTGGVIYAASALDVTADIKARTN